MPFAVAGPVLGAVAGAAASAAFAPGTSGGSGGGGGGPNYYIPTGLQTADQQWQGLQGNNYNTYTGAGLQQYGEQSLDAQLANVTGYAPQLQQGANAAGAQYGALGQQLGAASGQEFGAGNQLYQSAFDPQNALYNRSVQQLQDQTGATNSMYGLGSSAAGAGVANQALGNFNIDWQNQQLQRQLQGVQGMGQAYGQGQSLGAAGAGYTQQGSQLPYQTAQQIAGAPGQLGGQYGSYLQSNVYGPAQGIQGQAIPYMNYGQGAQSVPYQNATQGAGAAGALVSQGINAIGNNPQVQQGLGNAFQNFMNPASGSFSGGDFSGAFNSSPYYSGGGNSYGFTM
jgi:hypothetical protein